MMLEKMIATRVTHQDCYQVIKFILISFLFENKITKIGYPHLLEVCWR